LHPRRDDLLRTAFVAVALIFAALFLFMALTQPNYHAGIRFKPGNFHPNWWGELLVVMSLGAVLARQRLFFYGAVPFIFLSLIMLQSRGALLTSVIIVAFGILAREGWRCTLIIGAVMLFFVLPLMISVDLVFANGRIFSGVVSFVGNDVLLLNDPLRGLDSGISGRAEGYAIALERFNANPILGFGFGQSNKDVADELGTGLHNGHMALLIDLGVFMYAIILFIMLGALARAMLMREWLISGFILAFMFFIFFASRSINASVVPMTGWLMIAIAWVSPGRATAHSTAPLLRRTVSDGGAP